MISLNPNQIRTHSNMPIDIGSVDVYLVLLEKQSVTAGTTWKFADGSLSGTTIVSGTLTDLPDLSNATTGKKLEIYFDGKNLNTAGSNTITIIGTSVAGPTSEVINVTGTNKFLSAQLWMTISSISISLTRIDTQYPVGALQISEAFPINRPENNGTFADLYRYDNGVFTFRLTGTDQDFNLSKAYYLFDYPLPIHIGMNAKNNLMIGSDILGQNNLDGSIEKAIFFNEQIKDIRVGEMATDNVSFTELFNRAQAPLPTPDNSIYLDFNGSISQTQPNSNQFFGSRTSTQSINESFGDALIVDTPTEIPNADGIFSAKQGTVEFWIEPLEDIMYGSDQNQYIFDTTSLASVEATSITSTTVILPFRIKSIFKVYLKGDSTKTNLAKPNSLKSDFKTITLGSRLPRQKTELVIEYVPLNAYGDRVELYLDGYSVLTLKMTSDNKVATLARQVDWQRGSKHRIMFSYDIGNSNTLKADKIQMFVDGTEDSIITWGTPGLLWGNGHIWGTSGSGQSGSQALITELPIFEDFATLIFGSNFNHDYKYKFKLDNLRFSSVARTGTQIGNAYYDLDFNDAAVATPVIVDTWTKALFDFDRTEETSVFMANLLSVGASQYSIVVDIDDGFRKLIDNARTKEALLNIYQMAKPAHMRLYANYKQSGNDD